VDDLCRMFGLLRRGGVEGGLAAMRDVMGGHLRETGKALVLDPERSKEPVDYVQVGEREAS
jgi:cullin 3